MESHSRILAPGDSPRAAADRQANVNNQRIRAGRPEYGPPIAIIDIGSNSVRLVVYEDLGRSPAQLFNEKVMCGLGRSVSTSGRLAEDAVERALKALARFRTLCDIMQVSHIHILATAAARDAANGPDFIAEAERILGQKIELLSGKREALLSAYGILSGFYHADGVVGDLGGGSLELIEVVGNSVAQGITTRLGGLALQDVTGGSLKKAAKLIRDTLEKAEPLRALKGRNFYAVGGTWRSLAALHMGQKGYPLHIMHNYAIPAREAVEFGKIIERADTELLESIDNVSEARRPLLGYGALLLDEIIRLGKPEAVIFSAVGVREGYLYELLTSAQRKADPLLVGARELNALKARAPLHGDDLIEWTSRLVSSLHLDETEEEKRLRYAACLLSDIAWRAHPDYRGEQSLSLITHGTLTGIDHPGRAFVGLAVYFRHEGLSLENAGMRMRELISPRMLNRARILGGMMRVAYIISGGMPGVLQRTPLVGAGPRLVLSLPPEFELLGNERLANRLRQLARIVGREPAIVTAQHAGTAA